MHFIRASYHSLAICQRLSAKYLGKCFQLRCNPARDDVLKTPVFLSLGDSLYSRAGSRLINRRRLSDMGMLERSLSHPARARQSGVISRFRETTPIFKNREEFPSFLKNFRWQCNFAECHLRPVKPIFIFNELNFFIAWLNFIATQT